MYLRHSVRSPSHLRHEDANEQVKVLLPYRGDVAIHDVAQVAGTDCVRFRPTYLSHIGRIPARRCWTPYLKSDGNGQQVRHVPINLRH